MLIHATNSISCLGKKKKTKIKKKKKTFNLKLLLTPTTNKFPSLEKAHEVPDVGKAASVS